MLKDYSREYLEELPYTNPSLFQSPGGRKFLVFLSIFTTFVLRRQLATSSDTTHCKTLSRNKNIRKCFYKSLMDKTGELLANSVKNQSAIGSLETDSSSYVQKIVDKYYEHTMRIQSLSESMEFSANKTITAKTIKENFIDHNIMTVKENLSKLGKNFDTVKYVMEGGADKTKLNLMEFNVGFDGSSLVTFYQSLLNNCLSTAEEIVVKKIPINFPKEVFIENEVGVVEQMQSNLEYSYLKTKNNVNAMLISSLSVVSAIISLF